MRRRFQKGKGVTRKDVLDFPLLGLLAGASYVTDKVAHSKRKKTIKTERKNKKSNKLHDGSPASD